MNDIKLIRAVEKHPILFYKSIGGFNKTKMRSDAWKNVQKVVKVSEAECKKRWKTLRDNFIKLHRTQGGRTQSPYIEAMKFLLPHVEATTDIPRDSDELFLQSCAPILKRLTLQQNSIARLRIQQALHEAEFGYQTELPEVTPAPPP